MPSFDMTSRRELFDKYEYDIITSYDIEEMQNILDYAAGLIIKNQDLADAYETKVSNLNSSTYIKACFRQDQHTDAVRENIKKMYMESNKYYKYLQDEYNIDPLDSRLKEDYEIITSINKYNKNGSNLLEPYQEDLFLKCYENARFYWFNVTRTKAFQAEEQYRNFFETYLIFCTIQKYITERMKYEFDVDTFTKMQCKNYFISNGVDYFDEMPIYFQKRLIKLLNDLQLNKGDNEIFENIKDVLSAPNLQIYKYILTRFKDDKNNEDLWFYKTPYEEELNTDTNAKIPYEEITGNDPYWRASKNEILYQKFNILDTKYISIENTIDILKNSYIMSYYMHLLNELMLQCQRDHTETKLAFADSKISSEKIRLYDATLALFSLFLTFITNDKEWGDDIAETNVISPLIENIMGYNYSENEESKERAEEVIEELINYINEVKTNVFQQMNDLSIVDTEDQSERINEEYLNYLTNLKNFLTNFGIKNFYYSEAYSFESIMYYYEHPYKMKGAITSAKTSCKRDMLTLARFIKESNIYDHINDPEETINFYNYVYENEVYDTLDHLKNLIFSQDLDLEYLGFNYNLKLLFKKYLAYLIINEKIKTTDEIVRNNEDYLNILTNTYNENAELEKEFVEKANILKTEYDSNIEALETDYDEERITEREYLKRKSFLEQEYNKNIDNLKKYIEKNKMENEEYIKNMKYLEQYKFSSNQQYMSSHDIFYNFFINNTKVYDEFIKYNIELYEEEGYAIYDKLKLFIDTRYAEDGPNNLMNLIYSYNSYLTINDRIYKYRNLITFLDIFTDFKAEIYSNSKNSISNDLVKHLDLSVNYNDTDVNSFMDILNRNEKFRKQLEDFIVSCNDRKIYNLLKELWYLKFKSDFNYSLYAQSDRFKDYIIQQNEDLYNYITRFGTFVKEDEEREEIANRILYLSNSIENYLNTEDGFIYNSTFNITNFRIKDFAQTIINVFKAYTLDTIYAKNNFDFDDRFSSHIKLFDQLGDDGDNFITDLEFSVDEYIDIKDGIVKDDGYVDAKYIQPVQFVVNFGAEDSFINQKINEYNEAHPGERVQDILKCDIYIYEENDHLPYALSDNKDNCTLETFYQPPIEYDALDVVYDAKASHVESGYSGGYILIDQTKKFFIRPYANDNFWIPNRIFFNKKILPNYPSLPSTDYLPTNIDKYPLGYRFLVYNDKINSHDEYSKQAIFELVEEEINGENTKYFKKVSSSLEFRSLELSANRVDHVYLELGKYYITFAAFQYRKFIDFYVKLGLLQENIEYKFLRKNNNELFDSIESDDLEPFASLTGSDKENAKKLLVITKANKNEAVLWKYTGGSENNGFTEVGPFYRENSRNIFYEPMRFYNHESYDEIIIKEDSGNRLPNVIEVIEGNELLPEPTINTIEKVYHRNYEQKSKFSIMTNEINLDSFAGEEGTGYLPQSLINEGYNAIWNYSPSVSTSVNIDSDKFKFIIPETINDNAKLLTFYINGSHDISKTNITIEIEDTNSTTSNFAYIAVKNRGITNHDSSNIERPLLQEMVNLNNSQHLNFDFTDINTAAETINDIYDVDHSDHLYDEDLDYIPLLNENKEYYMYDYDYCNEYNMTEEIVESGMLSGSIHTYLMKSYIGIYDNNGKKLYENTANSRQAKLTIEDVSQDATLTANILVAINTEYVDPKNFLFNLKPINDNINIIGTPSINYFYDGNLYYATAIIKFKPSDIEGNLKIKLSGLVIFEDIIEIDSFDIKTGNLVFNPGDQPGIIYYQDSEGVMAINVYDYHDIESTTNKILIQHKSNNLRDKIYSNEETLTNVKISNIFDTSKYEPIYNITNTIEKELTFPSNKKDIVYSDQQFWNKNTKIFDDNHGNTIIYKDDSDIKVTTNFNSHIKNMYIKSTTEKIDDSLFNNSNIESFVFPPKMKYIGIESFNNSKLSSIYFQNNLRNEDFKNDFKIGRDHKILSDYCNYLKIDKRAFKNTKEFKNTHFEVDFPTNLGILGLESFENSTINHILFDRAEDLMAIDSNTFKNCKYLNRRYLLNSDDSEYKINNTYRYEGEEGSEFDENKQPTSNYKFSEMRAIILPYNKAYPGIRLNNNVFEDCEFIRTIDCGNTIAATNYTFQNCYRLLNVLMPEIIYLGSFGNTTTINTRDIPSGYTCNYRVYYKDNGITKVAYSYYYNNGVSYEDYVIIGDTKYQIYSTNENGNTGVAKSPSVYSSTKRGIDIIADYPEFESQISEADKNKHFILFKDEITEELYLLRVVTNIDGYDFNGYGHENIYGGHIKYIKYDDHTAIQCQRMTHNNTSTYGPRIQNGFSSQSYNVQITNLHGDLFSNCLSLVDVEISDDTNVPINFADNNFHYNVGLLKYDNTENKYGYSKQYTTEFVYIGNRESYSFENQSIDSSKTNLKMIYEYYDPIKLKQNINQYTQSIFTDSSDLSKEYYDDFEIRYHGTLEGFNSIKKANNWNARSDTPRFTGLNLNYEGYYNAEVQNIIHNLHETDLNDNQPFNGNNYFTYGILDNRIKLTNIKNMNDEHSDITFDIYSLNNFNRKQTYNDSDELSKIYRNAQYTIEHFENMLKQHNADRLNPDKRDKTNEYYYRDPSNNNYFQNRKFFNVIDDEGNYSYDDETNYKLNCYESDGYHEYNGGENTNFGNNGNIVDPIWEEEFVKDNYQTYFTDLNIIKFKKSKFDKKLYGDDIWKFTLKSDMKNDGSPYRVFMYTGYYQLLTFENDDNTGYYVNKELYNSTANELKNKAKSNNNRIFRDTINIYSKYGWYTGLNKRPTAYEERRYVEADSDGNKLNNNVKLVGLDNTIGNVLFVNESNFNDLLKPNTLLSPDKFNYANYTMMTQVNWSGYIARSTFGDDMPRGHLDKEFENNFYNLESFYPIKINSETNELEEDTDERWRYLDLGTYLPLNYKNNSDIIIPASDGDAAVSKSSYYTEAMDSNSWFNKYVSYDQFKYIPQTTANIVITDESITNNVAKSKFSFIYKIYDIIIENGYVTGIKINGWNHVKLNNIYARSEQITVRPDWWYTDNDQESDNVNLTNAGNILKQFKLSDVFEDIIKNSNCTPTTVDSVTKYSTSGLSKVRIAYAGGIREFTI